MSNGIGLKGIIIGNSSIGLVEGTQGVLLYRGYPVQVLAQKSNYLETAYLLLHEKLPCLQELKTFDQKLRKLRRLPTDILKIMKLFPQKTHPMVALQTVVSALDAFGKTTAGKAKDISLQYDRSLELISQFPTIVASYARIQSGKKVIEPNPKLDHGANFLYMLSGKVPDPKIAKMFDVCLVLHAEHGFNASTFTGRVVASTFSSLHAAIAGAIGSLYGPLHGGANEKVLEMISEIKNISQVEQWVLNKFERKEKIMGMGHAIYTVKDPRAYILEEMLKQLSTEKKNTKDYELLKKIEDITRREMDKRGKNIWPNVDFFSGALYTLMGIPSQLFTPIFAIARIAGWCAHAMEQFKDNQILRPDCNYTGPRDVSYVSIEKR